MLRYDRSLTQTGNAKWRTEKEDSRIGTNPGENGDNGDGGGSGEGGDSDSGDSGEGGDSDSGDSDSGDSGEGGDSDSGDSDSGEGGAGSHCLGWPHSQDITLILHSSVWSRKQLIPGRLSAAWV